MAMEESEWMGWCEETARQTACEVATVLRASYPEMVATVVAPSPSSIGISDHPIVAAQPANGLSSQSQSHIAAANDLIRRFVEVFTHHLESEILHGGSSDTTYSLPVMNGHQRNGHSNNDNATNDSNHSHQKSLSTTNSEQSQSREGGEDVMLSDAEHNPSVPTTSQAPANRKQPFYRRYVSVSRTDNY